MSERTKFLLLFLFMISTIFGLVHFINEILNLPDDNPIEQGIEAVIKTETGIDIDLTPNS
jgi:hypothetical protein